MHSSPSELASACKTSAVIFAVLPTASKTKIVATVKLSRCHPNTILNIVFITLLCQLDTPWIFTLCMEGSARWTILMMLLNCPDM